MLDVNEISVFNHKKQATTYIEFVSPLLQCVSVNVPVCRHIHTIHTPLCFSWSLWNPVLRKNHNVTHLLTNTSCTTIMLLYSVQYNGMSLFIVYTMGTSCLSLYVYTVNTLSCYEEQLMCMQWDGGRVSETILHASIVYNISWLWSAAE